jgi:predicted dehydrogenase
MTIVLKQKWLPCSLSLETRPTRRQPCFALSPHPGSLSLDDKEDCIVNIGIIGLGFMGVTHIAGYAKIPGVVVSVVCTENPAVLAGDLSKIGGNIQFDSGAVDISSSKKCARWQDVVADPSVDAVDICLPTDLHAAVAAAALAAGKHVLCEKPMALTEADCELMIEAAAKNKRVLMIGQVLRFWPEYMVLQEFGAARKYGAIRSATFVRQCGLPEWSKWLPVEARSGGATFDLLIHDIDQALLLCGMPELVSAKKLGDGDGIMGVLIYPGGPEVRIQGGWLQPGVPLSMTFQAVAERGLLELAAAGLFLSDMSGRRTKVEPGGPDGYQAEVDYFVECCRNGTEPLRCPPHASAQAVQIALRLKQSRSLNGEQIKC